MIRIELLIITLFIWLNACQATIEDKIPPEIGNLWPAEEAVLNKVSSGMTANLKDIFGDEEEHLKIRGKFIKLLISNKFKGADVHQFGVRIENATIIDPIFLEYAEIPFEVKFNNCRFKDEVIIKDSHFKSNLWIIGKKSYLEKKVEFIRIAVDKSVYLNQTIFADEVLFYGSEIGKEFGIVESHFKKKSDFKDLKVGRNAFLNQAEFKESADFSGVKIEGNLYANALKFLNEHTKANFNDLTVQGSVIFPEAIFAGGVSLEWARMKHLEFSGVRARDITLSGASIEDTLTIIKAEIDNLQAQRLSVKLAEFEDITIKNKVDLTGAHIGRKLRLSRLNLNSLLAYYLRVKGPATFEILHIKNEADFHNAALETLEFIGVTWPVEQAKRKLDGLTYTCLSVDKPNNFEGALELVEQSAFNPQNYMQLEDYCKLAGGKKWADKVYVAMKDQELKLRPWYVRWLQKIFWGWPAGYGRKPMRLLVASLTIILLGTALFNPKHLENNKNPLKNSLPSDSEYSAEDKKRTHAGKFKMILLRFLISLDQFLPAVNLGLADYWKAKDTHFLIWLFFTLEQGFGWIFVSIGLAAIYSQIK